MTINTKPIKVIVFDWSGTLAHPGTRHTFLYSNSIDRKLSTLRSDAIDTIKRLHSRGIKLGILSNTQYHREPAIKALKRVGLAKYFDFLIFSSDDFTHIPNIDLVMCSKPCPKIFKAAIALSKELVPRLSISQILYVGDNYDKDMRGAKRVGMRTAFIPNPAKRSLHIQPDRLSRLKSHNYAIESLSELLDLPLASRYRRRNRET